MTCVGEIEEKYDKNVYHSFYPEEWPDNVSHIETSPPEREKMEQADSAEAKCRVLPTNRRYLPCHYFDLICGSGFGA